MRSKRILMTAATLAAVLLIGACGKENESKTEPLKEFSLDIFAMDTYMTVTAYGDRAEEAVKAAEAEVKRLDELLSISNENGETGRINASGEGTLSPDTKTLIDEALEIYDTTGGAFDITILPVMEAWGFTTDQMKVPSDSELEEALSKVDAGAICLNGDRVVLGKGQQIDFGGIAKGYTSDRIMDIFEEYEVDSGLVSLGGNVELYKTKPDGSLWKVGIKEPDKNIDSAYFGVLECSDCAVITSGGYERYFTDEDTKITYHHIIDPKTGYPSNNGIISATIVSKNGMKADGLSTAVYIMGLEGAEEYWREYGGDLEMILMTEDRTVYATEGIRDSFSTECEFNIITKE